MKSVTATTGPSPARSSVTRGVRAGSSGCRRFQRSTDEGLLPQPLVAGGRPQLDADAVVLGQLGLRGSGGEVGGAREQDRRRACPAPSGASAHRYRPSTTPASAPSGIGRHRLVLVVEGQVVDDVLVPRPIMRRRPSRTIVATS